MSNTFEIEEKLTEQAQTETNGDGYDAHTPFLDYHFIDGEMEFAFQWVLGSAIYGGCDIGEAFYVAKQIEDRAKGLAGRPHSWQQEWEKMAVRKEARAAAVESAISAKNELLKASYYYRAALISMLPDENPKFPILAEKSRSCFQKAAKLFNPPIEEIKISYKDPELPGAAVLPGYFMRVDNSGKKRKTLIMIGGGETFAEDLFFYIGPAAIERGYNFLTVDLPGQGMLPASGYFFKPNTEAQMKPVLDFAYDQQEVDTSRLAVYGISNGGYFVPRAAAYDERIRAVVVCSAIIDNYKMFKEMPFAKATEDEIKNWPKFKHDVIAAVAWRWGTDIKGQVEASKYFQLDPSKIYCPFLDLVASGEYHGETEKQQIACMDALPNPEKQMIISPEKEGATSHCIAENRSVMSQIVFDWLDKIFKKS
jgi:pimeloyl-ACP methyl ester carboxylesterase